MVCGEDHVATGWKYDKGESIAFSASFAHSGALHRPSGSDGGKSRRLLPVSTFANLVECGNSR